MRSLKYMKQHSRQQGSALLWVVIASSVIAASIYYTQQRLENQVKYAAYTRNRQTIAAITNFVQDNINCAATLAPRNRSNICPAGEIKTLQLYDSTMALTPGPDVSATVYGPTSSTTKARRLFGNWYVWLDCGGIDPNGLATADADEIGLRLFVAQWDATSQSFIKDPLTGRTMDMTHPQNPVTGVSGKSELCNDFFFGTPNTRSFTMNIDTLQAASAFIDSSGQLQGAMLRCDGRVGLMVDYLCRPHALNTQTKSCLNANDQLITTNCSCMAATGDVSPGCESIRTPFGLDWFFGGTGVSTCPSSATQWTAARDSFQDSSPDMGRIWGMASCQRFCENRQYTTGRMTGCDPSAGLISGVATDTNGGQADCLCIK